MNGVFTMQKIVKKICNAILQNTGILNDRELRKTQIFIQLNYQEMYLKWSAYNQNSYCGEEK